MAGKFSYINTGGIYKIQAAPTLTDELTGSNPVYQIRSTICLVDAPTTCQTCDTPVTVKCPINGIKFL